MKAPNPEGWQLLAGKRGIGFLSDKIEKNKSGVICPCESLKLTCFFGIRSPDRHSALLRCPWVDVSVSDRLK